MIETRLAEPRDAPALAELGEASFWDAYRGTASDEDVAAHVRKYFSAEVIRQEMLQPRVSYLMAHESGQCAGLAKVRDGDPHACVDADTAVELQQLYVSPNYQRRGVGRVLMDGIVELARDRRVNGIWLSVWSGADWAAAFYENCGFEQKGTDNFHLGSEVHLDHIMWLPVDKLPG